MSESLVTMERVHTSEGVKWKITTRNRDEITQEEIYNSNAEALRNGVIFAAAEDTVLQVVPWPEMVGEAEEITAK